MKSKQLVKVVLIWMSMTTMLPSSLQAEAWNSSGNYDISWYNGTDTEFYISTSAQLAGLAVIVNNGYSNFRDKTVYLTDDIDVSGKDWMSIGQNKSNYFQGTFDGQSHTINGVSILKNSSSLYYGFFGYCSATIRNLTLKGNVSIVGPTPVYDKEHYVGALAGYVTSGRIEGCRVEMDMVYTSHVNDDKGLLDEAYVGGIVGYSSAYLYYCYHEGQIKFTINPEVAMQSSFSNGNGTTTVRQHYLPDIWLGGVAGYARNLYYCENNSSLISMEVPKTNPEALSGQYSDMYIGGIAGEGSAWYCRNICNKFTANRKGSSGSDDSKFKLYVGGIVGSTNSNVYNNYSITHYVNVPNNGNYVYCMFGGIGGSNNSSNCFSNSDYSKDYMVKAENYSGSTSYTSSQMKDATFLQEINMVSNNEWTADAQGYPCIAITHNNQPIVKVNSIVLNKTTATLGVNEELQLSATVLPSQKHSMDNKRLCCGISRKIYRLSYSKSRRHSDNKMSLK